MADGYITIDTRINTAGFEQGAGNLEAACKRTAQRLQAITKKMTVDIGTAAADKASRSAKRRAEEPQAATGGEQVKTEEYKALEAQITQTTAALDKLIEKEIRFVEIGGNRDTMTFKGMEYDIDQLRAKLETLQAQKTALEQSGGAYMPVTTGQTAQLQSAGTSLQQVNQALGASFAALGESLGQYGSRAAEAATQTGSLSGAGRQMESTANKMASSIGRATSKVKDFFKRVSSGSKTAGTSFGQLLRYSLGMQSLYSAIQKLISGMREGFQNLAKYDAATNKSISAVSSALAQLKNSLATAFAPIVNVVAPILAGFINLLSQAVTAIGMFVAALTGQKTFVKATAVQKDYAASLGTTAGAAGEAAKALKNLSSLDEINTFQSSSNSGGSGGGGGSSGGGGIQFETVGIDSAMNNWAEKFKEAWEKADFTEIGGIVGGKITDALDHIPWGTIQAKANKVATSLATFLNGAIETPGLWTGIGTTVAQSINTVLDAMGTFSDEFHWYSLGNGLTSGLYTELKTLEWGSVTWVFSSSLTGLLNLLSGAVDGIPWKDVPQDIRDAIVNGWLGIQWKDIFSALGSFLGVVMKAATELGEGLLEWFQQELKSAWDTFEKDLEATGGNIPKAIVRGFLRNSSWGTDALASFLDGLGSELDWWEKGTVTTAVDVGKEYVDGLLTGFEEGEQEKLYKKGKKASDNLRTWWDETTSVTAKTTKIMGKYVGDAATEIEKTVSDTSANTEKTTSRSWSSIVKTVSDSVKAAAKDVDKQLPSMAKTTSKTFSEMEGNAAKSMGGLNTKISGGTRTLRSNVSADLEKVKSSFKGTWSATGTTTTNEWKKMNTDVTNSAMSMKTAITSNFSIAEKSMKDTATRMSYQITNAFNDMQTDTASAFSLMSRSILSTFTSLQRNVKGPMNGIISHLNNMNSRIVQGMNTLATAMSRFRIAIPGSSPLTVSITRIGSVGRIPYLATGAVIPPNSPFLAVMGDQKRGQNIEAPADLIRQIVREEAGGGGNVTFTAQLNRRTIFEQTIEEAKLRQLRTGKNPFNLDK